MSDQDPDRPEQHPGQPPAPQPAAEQPASYPPPNPQAPYPSPWDPWQTAPQQPGQQQGQQPGQQPVQQPGPYPTQQLPVQQQPLVPPRAKVPAWLVPAVALLALVLGLAGGAVGALLVGGAGGVGGNEVISVQKRQAAPLPADNTSVAAVAQKVLPSTVQIVAEYDGKDQGATGSGFVLDDQGHIITNNHVVAEADEDDGPIDIIDQQGNHFPAKVVGRSTVYDIAVLKAPKATKLQPVALGSSDQMRVGETVVAVGSPLGLSATVTSGIVSAVNRPVTTGDGANDNSYINAVQTDAAINPGNSGGPLVNLQGEVVGVNSAIASLGSQFASDQGGSIGVGFAIPVEQVQVTTQQILRTGKAQYPVIGANVRGRTQLDGAIVESVTSGSPAADAELRKGDIIRKVDGKPVAGSSDVVVAIRTHTPGEKVTLTVQRGKRTFEVKVGLEAKTG